jgi:hypothetical protein
MKTPPDTPNNPILTLITNAQPVNNGEIKSLVNRQVNDYFIDQGAMWVMLKRHDRHTGQVHDTPTALTINFSVLITEQLTLDDGIATETVFVLEGKTQNGQTLPTVTINATLFPSMSWTWKHYGGRALLATNQATPRLLSTGIVMLSGDIPIITVYQHTGWREIDNQWQYLSGSGAIGAEGLNPAIRVDLGAGNMQRYRLPAPVDDPKRVAGLFSLLEIAPANRAVGVALLCCVIRAALGECLPTDFALFLVARFGAHKSECAALALACFGDFNSKTFPANFSDTESDLEHKAHQSKDAVFVVDDYVMSVSQQEANKTQVKAERVIRGAGNQSGRGRCNADMSSKAAYFPRGMIIATGEDTPKTPSLLARALVIELKRGDVNLSYLSALQHQAEKGELAAIMAAFLQWLAPRLTELKRTFPARVRGLRDEALNEKFVGSHPRAPDTYASLLAAADIYIDFAHELGAISSIRANDLADQIKEDLQAAMRAQSQYQTQMDEIERFKALLCGCFAAGECHVGDYLNQGPPEIHPFIWGWRKPNVDAEIAACGMLIGWINQAKGELWLEPEATFKAIQRFAQAQNDPLLIQKHTLYKRILERGLLAAYETEKGVKRPDAKRSVAGKRTRVLVFHTSLISDPEAASLPPTVEDEI